MSQNYFVNGRNFTYTYVGRGVGGGGHIPQKSEPLRFDKLTVTRYVCTYPEFKEGGRLRKDQRGVGGAGGGGGEGGWISYIVDF